MELGGGGWLQERRNQQTAATQAFSCLSIHDRSDKWDHMQEDMLHRRSKKTAGSVRQPGVDVYRVWLRRGVGVWM
jgi:hypothetical protein